MKNIDVCLFKKDLDLKMITMDMDMITNDIKEDMNNPIVYKIKDIGYILMDIPFQGNPVLYDADIFGYLLMNIPYQDIHKYKEISKAVAKSTVTLTSNTGAAVHPGMQELGTTKEGNMFFILSDSPDNKFIVHHADTYPILDVSGSKIIPLRIIDMSDDNIDRDAIDCAIEGLDCPTFLDYGDIRVIVDATKVCEDDLTLIPELIEDMCYTLHQLCPFYTDEVYMHPCDTLDTSLSDDIKIIAFSHDSVSFIDDRTPDLIYRVIAEV